MSRCLFHLNNSFEKVAVALSALREARNQQTLFSIEFLYGKSMYMGTAARAQKNQ